MKNIPRSLAAWLWLSGGLFGAVALVALTSYPSATSAQYEPADRFSAERAMRIVRRLCDEIGMRQNGTAAHARAAKMLAEELRTIPGVEVELQQPSGVQRYKKPPFPFPPFVYKTTNVVARLPGRSQEALLLNAHYDTATDSVGAGDDALGVAVMVETLRVLANGPKLEHSIVVNLNGDEELGMLGAAGFLQHPLAKDVRAYLYIDSGPRGRTLVLGTGPGNAWLLKEYASAGRSIPATVIGEDLVSSGLLPHSGDFLPFHEAGLVGVDLAAIDDFWSVHTNRDRPERIDQTTIQLMGDNLLAGARRLANGPLPGNVDKAHFIYYDVLGLFVLIYGLTTARVLALVALGLAVFVLVVAIRRKAFTLRQVLGALGRTMLMALAAILAAILIALLLGFGLHRPHGWFSSPPLAVWVFGTSSMAAALAILFWRRRRRPDEPDLVAWAGGLCFWSLLLGLTTYANIGAGYFALWWTLGMAAGLLGTLLVPKWRGACWLISFLPGGALVISTVAMILPFLIADTGLVAAPIPLDSVIAIFIAFAVVMLLPSMVAAIDGSSCLGRVSLGCGVVALAGAIATAVANPYSVERPKRITAALVQGEGASGMYLSSHDALPLGPALRNIPEARPLPTPWHVPKDAPFTYAMPAGKPTFAAPIIQVLSSSHDPVRNVRIVQLRLETDTPVLWFFVPRAALRGWSFGELPKDSADPTRFVVLFEDATPKDKEFTLELTDSDSVEVEMVDVRGPSNAPEIVELEKKLPPWTALDTSEIWSVKQKI
jgi:MFS family permease